MRVVALVAYAAFVITLCAATLVEWRWGTELAHANVYGSAWFAMLMAAVVVPGVAVALRRLRKRPPALALHLSFALIALGALATRLTGEEGTIHLREGQTARQFTDEDGVARELPTAITLDSFRIATYPHTRTPMDYTSHISIGGAPRTVSMNRVVDADGYRLLQAGYDADLRGTTLSVCHDPLGMTLSYLGYASLAASFLWLLLSPSGRFRRLLRALPSVAAAVALLTGVTSCAKTEETPKVAAPPQAKVEKFARLNIIYNGRIAPIGTYCSDFVQKVAGTDSWHGLSAEAVTLGWMLSPDEWQSVPMIEVKDVEAARRMGIKTDDGRTAAQWLFDEGGNYLLSPHIAAGDKAAIDIDDRLQAIVSLTDGTAFLLTEATLPPWRREMEVAYNHLRPTSALFKLTLTAGLAALLFAVRGGRRSKSLVRAFAALCLSLQAAALAARGIIAGSWPLGNGHETMLCLALALALGSLRLSASQRLLSAVSLLLSGFALLVAHLGMGNPRITPLMPVLHSPWLSIHVASIMGAYALLAIIAANSLMALCSNAVRQSSALRVSHALLYPALFLLSAGIFVGAVWAGESWGRYWGWDPKEVWALVTLLVYAVPLHGSLVPALRRPRAAHAYLVAAFATVLMTYFGVNMVLGGNHSYN